MLWADPEWTVLSSAGERRVTTKPRKTKTQNRPLWTWKAFFMAVEGKEKHPAELCWWLGLHAATAGGTGLIPGLATKSPCAVECGQKIF